MTGPESIEDRESLPVRMTPFGPAHIIPGELSRVEFVMPNRAAVSREMRKILRSAGLRKGSKKVKRVPRRKQGGK